MKKLFFAILSLLFAVLTATAVPARKGILKTLPLNGELMTAQLMGDEHMHFWQTDDGRCLTEEGDTFRMADMAHLRTVAWERRQKMAASRQQRVRKNAVGDFTNYSGRKKGLIILVEFSDVKFNASNDSLFYTRMCNEAGFSSGRFRGSVNDYFRDQSYGQFDLLFDVMGPVKMEHDHKYYGKDSGGEGNDMRPGEMVATACKAVADMVDFSDYDWDGDGYVDQVMCIYAGQGQADGGSSDTIWPHEWQLNESDYGSVLELDGVTIDTYAVANERTYSGVEGIGVICHEFSHCLGLPDMYDINYGGNYGMGPWSLMDSGSYNGDTFCPAGYSSFDKFTCGWVKPAILAESTIVEGMQPLSDSPEVYMVPNDAYTDEYLLIENRQQRGWDAMLPGSGLLILYVDYDHDIWANNLVNTISNSTWGGLPTNNHQRCTPFHADNGSGYYVRDSGVPYPYQMNDSLTNTSHPAARLHHRNPDGSTLLDKGILDIARQDDGLMTFRFRNSPTEEASGILLSEYFLGCSGSGGGDGLWNTSIASSNFVPDNEGWDVVKGYGGYKCARFGNASTPGRATTPVFNLSPLADDGKTVLEGESGQAMLAFRASGWNQDATTLTLSVEGNATIEPSEVQLVNFEWSDFEVRLHGKGEVRVTFMPERRFMLDRVSVVSLKGVEPTAISIVSSDDSPLMPDGYYTLDGRFMGTQAQSLRPGIYIIRDHRNPKGRKVIYYRMRQ